MTKKGNKTQATKASVSAFINKIENETRRKDGLLLIEIMEKITACKAKMWGGSIIGFGSYHYKYASGREGDFCMTAFSPRKHKLVLYIMPGYEDNTDLLDQLGKHKIGKSCLYLNKLADIDLNILKKLIKRSVDYMRANYECSD